MLTVGTIYSSFIEMLFANMFITSTDDNEYWRYNQKEKIEIKLGEKALAKFISPLLGLLYEPNKKSIDLIESDFDVEKFDKEKHSVHEKIWFCQL